MFSKGQFDMLKLNFEKFNSVNSETFYLPLVSGELILFPSHLRHSVPRNTSDEVRVSLSFNTFVTESLGSEQSLTYLNIKDIINESR
jgi:ectoine hydroxylase-related dioxygenase (phytanoyl-CoA dioxygenase family)